MTSRAGARLEPRWSCSPALGCFGVLTLEAGDHCSTLPSPPLLSSLPSLRLAPLRVQAGEVAKRQTDDSGTATSGKFAGLWDRHKDQAEGPSPSRAVLTGAQCLSSLLPAGHPTVPTLSLTPAKPHPPTERDDCPPAASRPGKWLDCSLEGLPQRHISSSTGSSHRQLAPQASFSPSLQKTSPSHFH